LPFIFFYLEYNIKRKVFLHLLNIWVVWISQIH